MGYSKQEIVKKVNESISNVKELYQNQIVNYRGKTTDSNEYYSETIIEELLNKDIVNLVSRIKEVTRKKGYRMRGHNGDNQTVGSNRKEEIFAKKLFQLSKCDKNTFNEIGEIIDYQ